MNDKRPIGIDLFAGAGGMSLGFEKAGFNILGAVEIDPVHCAVHEYNFPKTKMICSDICKITGQDIREYCGLKNDEAIHVVFGGAPCQGFSMIGKRTFDDPRNTLVKEYLRIVSELEPKYFVFENVKGLTLGKHRQFLEDFFEETEKMGYQIERQYQVLNALNYGVPQSRERLFLLGWRKGLKPVKYPLPTHNAKNKMDLKPTPTVFDAIGDLPDIEHLDELFENDYSENVIFGEPSEYVRNLNSPDDYSYIRVYNEKVLTSSTRTKHLEISIERFKNTEQGKAETISRFFKLSPTGHCNTLRAGTASDHGAHTSPRPIHPYKPRCITNREALRLHSYPDWFRVHVTKWHGFRQIGNSVPPLLAKAVASEVIKALQYQPTKPKKKIELYKDELLSFNMSKASLKFNVSKNVIPQRNRKKAKNG
ncbi:MULTISPECIES: DNA cytosine methyltransferase [unclassified Sulfurospirillum]|uniref:DNA cytosine methyltransferase n=1 Tax=unclassified Sulfurospirillum TaxID=2618290 RepID=UPI0004FF9170|nr:MULTISPECIES: DNA cytosine methyltransferase [unclassified Sulfurospirillum]KFL35289.1 DNA methyltransferase [Sulfurospirillum sp. SCADC]